VKLNHISKATKPSRPFKIGRLLAGDTVKCMGYKRNRIPVTNLAGLGVVFNADTKIQFPLGSLKARNMGI
jgi:hypothetical protein